MNVVEPFRDRNDIETMKKILAAGKMGKRNEMIFSIGINTAYRISDLRRLKLSDVLIITRGKVKVKERLAMKEKKTGKNNSILLSKKLQREILGYVEKEFPEAIKQRDFDWYLFPSRKGNNEPLTRQALWQILHEAALEAKIKHIGPHSMRKTFGYFLYKNGIDLEIIQSLLNHSSQRETLLYIGITQEDKDIAVMSLNL